MKNCNSTLRINLQTIWNTYNVVRRRARMGIHLHHANREVRIVAAAKNKASSHQNDTT